MKSNTSDPFMLRMIPAIKKVTDMTGLWRQIVLRSAQRDHGGWASEKIYQAFSKDRMRGLQSKQAILATWSICLLYFFRFWI